MMFPKTFLLCITVAFVLLTFSEPIMGCGTPADTAPSRRGEKMRFNQASTLSNNANHLIGRRIDQLKKKGMSGDVDGMVKSNPWFVSLVEIDPTSPKDVLDFTFTLMVNAPDVVSISIPFEMRSDADIRDLVHMPNYWYAPECTTGGSGPVEIFTTFTLPTPEIDYNTINLHLQGPFQSTKSYNFKCTQRVTEGAKPEVVSIRVADKWSREHMKNWSVELPMANFNTRITITGPAISNEGAFLDYNADLNHVLQRYDDGLNFSDWHYDVNSVHSYVQSYRSSSRLAPNELVKKCFEVEKSKIALVFNSDAGVWPQVINEGGFDIAVESGSSSFIGLDNTIAYLNGASPTAYEKQSIIQQGLGNRCLTTRQCNQYVLKELFGEKDCNPEIETCVVCHHQTCTSVYQLTKDEYNATVGR